MMHRYIENSMPSSPRLAIAAFLLSFLMLCTIPVQAVTSTKISGGTALAGESSLSGDGLYAVYIQDTTKNDLTRNVYRYNGTTSSFIGNSAPTDKANGNPSISADGTYVVSEFREGGFPVNYDLYKSTSGGTSSGFVVNSNFMYSVPSVDNTGTVVAYRKYYSGAYTAEVYNNGAITSLGTIGSSAAPVLSSDGQYVAYRSGANVYLKQSNGTAVATITGDTPAISYKGERVAYVDGGNVKVYNRLSSSVECTIAAGSDPAISKANDATDGNFVAYVASDGHVKVYDITRGTTRDFGIGTNPSVSADGNTVSLETGSAVYVVKNEKPVATAQSVSTAEDTATGITLAGTDAEGDTLTYTVVASPTHGDLTGTAPNLTFTPDADYNGADSFTFKVNDGTADSATTATVSITITAVNDNPTANDNSFSVAEDSGANTLDVLANDSIAPDAGETLTITGVTQGTHGAVAITNGGANLSYTPAANYNGADSFTYTISDGNGGTDTATVSITVTPLNDPPVATPQSVTTPEDTPKAITLAGTDPDTGDTLTFAVVTQPVNGDLTGTAPNLTYTPDANYNGSDSFTFKVNDGTVDSAPATVSITVTAVNDDPTANNDSFSVDEDSSANTLNVLANDSCAPDTGETLTITGITQGAHGAVVITNSGAGLTYEPTDDYVGADSFTYTISDGNGGTDTATVSITVVAMWTVTPSAGSNGSISPDTPQSVRNNESIGFTATGNIGYVVDKWTVDSVEAQVGGASFTLSNVTANHAVQVTFKVATYTVTASVEGTGGSITPSGASTVNYGGYLFFTATPNIGYGVQKWQVDDADVQTGGLTYELNNITADHTVKVFFSEYDAPTVSSITPNSHLNTGKLSVTNLAGTGFRPSVTVQLTKTGEPSITATNVVVVSGTQITCDFNFSGNAAGAWNVVVTNDDGKSATLADAITLTLAPPTISYITPNSGINTGTVAITNLAGSGFVNPSVKLTNGVTDIPMTGVTLFGLTTITGSFDLTGATPGAWDVVVTNGDSQFATLANGFTIGAEPPPAPTSVSPTSVQKPGTKTITVNGTDFDAADATVKLTKSGEADLVLTMTSRTATQLQGTIDITGKAVGQWNVVVTNHPGAGNERSATLTNALAIVEAALTGVTLTTNKAWPQPTGATITLTATKTGTATSVEYQFWVKTLNRLTSLPEYTMLRDYDTADTFDWKPISDNSYWLFVYAREVGSGLPFQVASAEVYYKIEVATLTGVTLAVLPAASPQPVNTEFTLTATNSGTAVDVEYQFVYKWYNPAKSKWVDGYIRGYATNNTCTWTPTVAGNYRIYAMVRIVGSTALFDKISAYKAYTINP